MANTEEGNKQGNGGVGVIMVMAAVFEQGKRKGKKSDGHRNLPLFYFFAYLISLPTTIFKYLVIDKQINMEEN
jgi:hypothetical protein